MKRLLAAVMASTMLLIGSDAFAQIQVGLGYVNTGSTVKIDSKSNTTSYNGFTIGGAYDINIVKGLSIVPGLHYTYHTTGEQEIVSFLGRKVTAKNQEHFIGIPVDFKYSFDVLSSLKLFAYAGPDFQFQVGQKYEVKAGNNNWSDSEDSDDIYKFDVLLGGGVGADICENIRFTVGYKYGLINLYDGEGSDKISQHRGQLAIGLSYLF